MVGRANARSADRQRTRNRRRLMGSCSHCPISNEVDSQTLPDYRRSGWSLPGDARSAGGLIGDVSKAYDFACGPSMVSRTWLIAILLIRSSCCARKDDAGAGLSSKGRNGASQRVRGLAAVAVVTKPRGSGRLRQGPGASCELPTHPAHHCLMSEPLL